MKLNIDYKNDPRWSNVSEQKQKDLFLPNEFVDILYKYKDKIPKLEEIKFAIETGTHDAKTSVFLSEHFDKVFTVELFPDKNPYDGKSYREIYQEISKINQNINFLFGNSSDVLKSIFEEYPNERFFILLDAHSMEKGPLKEELQVIKEFSNCKNHVFLVDDCRDLGLGDYPTLTEFTETIKSMNTDYTIENTLVGNHVFLIY